MKQLAMAVCALAISAPGFAQDASGKWQVTVTTEQRGPRNTSMVLEKDGDKLSGTLVGPESRVLTLAGTQTGADIVLSFTVQTDDGPLPVSMKGRQDGDTMKGVLEFGTDGRGDWTAARSAATPQADTVDLTGMWTFQVATDAGARTATAALKQDGERLSGQYKSMLGEAAVTGQIKGSAFSFQVTLPIEGTPMTILYTGTADRDGALAGKVSVGDTDVGTFTAKKETR